ncbi:MAG: tpl protein [Coriobacteriia bacterium]|nr:tpl protein [Coriobacteriia bacterium]
MSRVKVVGVRFRHSKVLWFDPQDFEPALGDRLIVETERGTEMGECVQQVWEVETSELPAPLKPVVRIADEEDLCTDKELQLEEAEAIPIFREYIEKNSLDMKPADVEIIFGKEKMIFYFSAEERIDFRQLVRDLAAHFHCRIEMRQVGVRDEARMTGGIAHCGEILCCKRLGGEFAPVSIKMAKDQGLPLNPSKISGVCGRLMCCLRYEAEAYKDFNKRSPKRGALIETPRGKGKVVERDAIRETVKLQFRGEDHDKPEDTMIVPLARMCCKDKPRRGKEDSSGCGGCPCAVSKEDFEAIVEENKRAKQTSLSTDGLDFMSLSSTSDSSDAGSAVDNGKQPARGPKRSRRNRGESKDENKESSQESSQSRKRGRRRGGKGRGKGRQQDGQNQQAQPEQSQDAKSKSKPKPRRRKPKNKQQQANKMSAPETRVPRRRNRDS